MTAMDTPTLNPLRTADPTTRGLLTVVAVTLLLVLPFAAKPLHTDDPMYVWAARHIAAHPLDPYGFTANWAGQAEAMVRIMQNPPLVPYYMAAASAVLGWGEVGLHLAFAPVAALAAAGTYLLAAQLCRRPLAAALLLVLSPAFLVSATTLMCELPLLCLWVWAALLWIRGSAATTARAAWLLLIGSGIAAALAPLAKYPGVNVLPLLVAHAVLCPPTRRANRWPQAVALLVPIAVLIAYDRLTAARYGYGLLSDAFGYSHSANASNPVPLAGRTLDALCFLGGGGLTVAAAALARAGRRAWAAVPVVVVLALAAGHWFSTPIVWALPQGPPAWGYFLQCGLLATAGVAVLVGCAASVGRSGDRRQGLFLMAWVAGVFTFAAFLNWSLNARSLLPLLPAASVLVVRSFDDARRSPRYAVVAGGVVALLAAVADYRFATDNRTAADDLASELRPRVAAATPRGGRPPQVWFGGHWGFQFYMERAGFKALDDAHRDYAPGDWVVLPLDNYGTRPVAARLVEQDPLVLSGSGPWMTTMTLAAGAGFYFSPGDRLPFVVGPVPPQAYRIARIGR